VIVDEEQEGTRSHQFQHGFMRHCCLLSVCSKPKLQVVRDECTK
jgi:hypothetical protein